MATATSCMPRTNSIGGSALGVSAAAAAALLEAGKIKRCCKFANTHTHTHNKVRSQFYVSMYECVLLFAFYKFLARKVKALFTLDLGLPLSLVILAHRHRYKCTYLCM